MARVMAADGVTLVAATPHVRDDFPTPVDVVEDGVRELRAALADAGIAIDVRTGGEVAVDWVDRAEVGDLRGYGLAGNRSAILVEFPYLGWPLRARDGLQQAARRGDDADPRAPGAKRPRAGAAGSARGARRTRCPRPAHRVVHHRAPRLPLEKGSGPASRGRARAPRRIRRAPRSGAGCAAVGRGSGAGRPGAGGLAPRGRAGSAGRRVSRSPTVPPHDDGGCGGGLGCFDAKWGADTPEPLTNMGCGWRRAPLIQRCPQSRATSVASSRCSADSSPVILLVALLTAAGTLLVSLTREDKYRATARTSVPRPDVRPLDLGRLCRACGRDVRPARDGRGGPPARRRGAERHHRGPAEADHGRRVPRTRTSSRSRPSRRRRRRRRGGERHCHRARELATEQRQRQVRSRVEFLRQQLTTLAGKTAPSEVAAAADLGHSSRRHSPS